MTDREKFLQQARTYIGVDGEFVCGEKLGIGFVCDWCAYSISSIMKDCGFIGKYQGDIYGFASDAAREDDGIYGEWFLKGERKIQPGDYIMFRYYYFLEPLDKYSASHVGIVESVNGDVITTLEGNVDGYGYDWAGTSGFKRKTRYLSSPDVYAFYRPYWEEDIKTAVSEKNSVTESKENMNYTSDNESNDEDADIDIFYQAHLVGGAWMPEVKNLEDFAGFEGREIDGIRARVSNGHIRYRVKCVGAQVYLPWVDDSEDYAGLYGRVIDSLQMEFYGVEGYEVKYRVALLNDDYLPFVYDYNSVDDDGFAGMDGYSIDRLQAVIVKINVELS